MSRLAAENLVVAVFLAVILSAAHAQNADLGTYNDSTVLVFDANNETVSTTKTPATTTVTSTTVAAVAGTPSPTLNEDNCDGGFPCEADQFCSQQWKRCRPCKDIEGRCIDVDNIHTSYPTCEKFCIRMKQEEADRVCEAEKNVYRQEISQLHQSVDDIDSTLNDTKIQAEADLAECSMEKEERSRQLADQDQQIKQLHDTVAKEKETGHNYRKELSYCEGDRDSLKQALIGVGVVCSICVAGAVTVAIIFWKKITNLRSQLLRSNVRQDSDRQRLIQECGKPPVQAERRSTNLGFNDQMIPGGARTPIFIRRDTFPAQT